MVAAGFTCLFLVISGFDKFLETLTGKGLDHWGDRIMPALLNIGIGIGGIALFRYGISINSEVAILFGLIITALGFGLVYLVLFNDIT